ncbi:hypothetical protein HDU96_003301 [Phlyctochytrium bullatum]|nr:hypothetical protein HDU96_003301 [Phlyctochytrium bullatum]
MPRITPLKCMADLDAWSAPASPGPADANRPRLGLQRRHARADAQAATIESWGVQKVLVCHDYAGGYKMDAEVQGVTGETAKDQYSMQQWDLVDEFVYFAHERFSIPPPGWVNAAHRNGVFVYATFITEWDGGVMETLKLIYGPGYQGYQLPPIEPNKPGPYTPGKFDPHYAELMVRLAEFYQFDGWFINIESDLQLAEHGEAMSRFVDTLTKLMHERIPGSKVLWYDSLTIQGRLRWQDRLSPLNKPFFDRSDGIFVNYTWHPTFPLESSSRAGPRRGDVFTGIDVWGRNTYGGGGFNVHKALRIIAQAGTSVALFAPGWTHEAFEKDMFSTIEARFWRGIPPLLDLELPYDENEDEMTAKTGNLRPGREDWEDLGYVAEFIESRPAGTTKRFYTDFDKGHGSFGYFVEGKRVFGGRWFNLSRQSTLPSPPVPKDNSFVKLDRAALTSALKSRPSRTLILHELEKAQAKTLENAAGAQDPQIKILESESAFSGGSVWRAEVQPDASGKVLWRIPVSKVGLELLGDPLRLTCRVRMAEGSPSLEELGLYALVETAAGITVTAACLVPNLEAIKATGWEEVTAELAFDARYMGGLVTEVGILAAAPGADAATLSLGTFAATTGVSAGALKEEKVKFEGLQPRLDVEGNTEVWVSWAEHWKQNGNEFKEDAAIDRWEVYVDDKWEGTAFADMFWISTSSKSLAVRCEGYDALGNRAAILSGTCAL